VLRFSASGATDANQRPACAPHKPLLRHPLARDLLSIHLFGKNSSVYILTT
jgi:hypothetical protein